MSVVPVPLAVAAQTYKSSLPEGISFNHPFAKLPVVIVPELVPAKETVTSPGFELREELDLWYAYTIALAVPVVPAVAFAIV